MPPGIKFFQCIYYQPSLSQALIFQLCKFAGMHYVRDAVSVREEGASHGPQQVLWRRERLHHPP